MNKYKILDDLAGCFFGPFFFYALKMPSGDEISKALLENVDPTRISKVLHALTSEPHIGGTPANRRVAEKIANIWRDNGLQGFPSL